MRTRRWSCAPHASRAHPRAVRRTRRHLTVGATPQLPAVRAYRTVVRTHTHVAVSTRMCAVVRTRTLLAVRTRMPLTVHTHVLFRVRTRMPLTVRTHMLSRVRTRMPLAVHTRMPAACPLACFSLCAPTGLVACALACLSLCTRMLSACTPACVPLCALACPAGAPACSLPGVLLRSPERHAPACLRRDGGGRCTVARYKKPREVRLFGNAAHNRYRSGRNPMRSHLTRIRTRRRVVRMLLRSPVPGSGSYTRQVEELLRMMQLPVPVRQSQA
ncbi:hypothetical protein BJY24_001566 [Nocardia transvalensis]|uniref:Uncharacterized protein n=1 Tax=Nocardia transvalensis TaxID=37333 RepID=A0A7W9PAW2_9NOCA|nr:hypothetical protein [Nocardia transvalensis]